MKGKRDPTTPKIGFHNWNLDAITEGAPELFNKAFKEALDLATEEYEVTATLYLDKTLHLRIELPFGPEEYDDPAWVYSMDELVDGIIELDDSETYTRNVRNELKRLTEKLTERLSRYGKE